MIRHNKKGDVDMINYLRESIKKIMEIDNQNFWLLVIVIGLFLIVIGNKMIGN